MTPLFKFLCDIYRDEPDVHRAIYDYLDSFVKGLPFLYTHRQWVEQNHWGMGDACFWGLWYFLLQQMPYNVSFLEIGVHKGAILSLVGMLQARANRDPQIVGITPLDGTGMTDQMSENYLEDIYHIHDHFNLKHPIIIKGLSQDSKVIESAVDLSPFDIIYIDGGHSFDEAKTDIENYAPMVRPGGYLVMDDASYYLHLPPAEIAPTLRYWPGLADVSLAVKVTLEHGNMPFKECFAVGHLRIWRKE